ncbi:uncharacterized protein PgNI_08168 [Pyricularia grisea]|uniref:Uncharacterized protein n=1 Tax=Pyricularia grisea TaxID=148305 RepID=A0A6P8AV04_PYRGI|nr:uncharacterized protein PgNI_08168 [Pyricularia grisea]TLD06053.1 hypothetical protein PgNI_08168 [Pyricularia grisea]
MAKKARQRIAYVLEVAGSQAGGHKLGVNGLAADRDKSILYSGGRDGIVCAWDLNLDLKSPFSSTSALDSAAPNGTSAPEPRQTSKFRSQTLAHTHWINDICLADSNNALVSASSDLTVKVWRPHADTTAEPVTIGQHADYVKCVATPSPSTNWVASGGLDRKIYLWDLNGGGKTLEIDVSGEEITEKGSVYALSVNHNILASGGPESTLRLWDPRSGKRITKFVGHTDNVRAILVNEAGDTVMTASSDQTVKVWSVTAGRCMHTLTMHNDSVWSLYSEDPGLEVFYSSDRSGMVVKTDVRGTFGELDEGLSVAIAKENDGVSKVLACGGHIWTATATSSINRWLDVETGQDALPEAFRQHRASVSTHVSANRQREGSVSLPTVASPEPGVKEIPAKSILRISNTAVYPATPFISSDANELPEPGLSRKESEIILDIAVPVAEPMQHLPAETIEGQFGLVKHRLLNDRRRVLTLDTAGEVLLWDLINCRPIQKFGKKHLEDVEPGVNTIDATAPWCSIDTSSGNLTVVLEPFNCFDAEMYADELVTEEPLEFREDQRINLGKWILRYLFANLVDEEIRRDEAFRATLNEGVEKRIAAAKANPPTSIAMPEYTVMEGSAEGTTPRANGAPVPTTPGLGIGLATPAPGRTSLDPSTPVDKRSSQTSRASVEKEDYFSNAISAVDAGNKPVGTPATAAPTEAPQTPATAEPKTPAGENGKDGKENGKSPALGLKKWNFKIPKISRSGSATAAEKPVVKQAAQEDENKSDGGGTAGSETSSKHEKEVDDSFHGVVQKIRNEYEKQLAEVPDKLVESKVAPSLPSETPVLKLPANTKIIIQEETSGGSAELYRGTVGGVGADVDTIEQVAPMWLGDVLLCNTLPAKEPHKVSFILNPYKDELPHIAAQDGNNRLNANRMLRVRKILAYVAERLEEDEEVDENDEAKKERMKPEEYLELWCNDQLLPVKMSLATLRARVWRGGADVVLHYRSNGKKELKLRPPPPPVEPAKEENKDDEEQEKPALKAAVVATTTTAAFAAALK